jgi:aryl-alcohol dehydrogenase-like predicted oxidoreductase
MNRGETMQTRRIGALEVSVVGVGCNNFGTRIDEAAAARVVDAALEAGIDLFDTADTYGRGASEEMLGRALKGRRERAVIATKFGSDMGDGRNGARPEYVRQAAEDSLRRLGVDVIDLYQLHKPDDSVPIADTLGALDELVRAGKVREVGCSNFSVQQLRDAEAAARASGGAPFRSVQNDYSLLHRAPEVDGVLAECERTDVAFLPYFPLFSGLLTGKYRKGQPVPQGTRIAGGGYFAGVLTEERLDVVEKLIAFAEARGHSILELAFSWLLARPVVASVIAGATRPEQIHANVAAAGWSLTPDDLAEIDRIAPAG